MNRDASVDGSEFRHGWTVVLAAAVGVGLGVTGLPIYTTGQFILPLQSTFGWSRSAVSAGFLCLTIAGVVMAPLIGALAGRWGVRRVAILGVMGMALGYASLTLNGGSIWLYDAGWVVLAVLGAGSSPIVWTGAVASWFDRQRGLALGLTLCGTGVTAILAPGLIGSVIAQHGWQAGFLALAAVQLVIGLPLVGLLFHARQDAAHDDRIGDSGTKAAGPALGGVAARQALRDRAFWQGAVAFFLIAIVIGGLIVHLPAMLADKGLAHGVAGAALGWLGVSLIAGRLSIGALLDRLPLRLVAPVFILLPVPACLLLLFGNAVVPVVLLFGLSAGAEVDLLAYLVSRTFGLHHYTRIYGWMLSAFGAGVGIGPVLAGWVHDTTGRYDAALYAFMVLMLLAATLISVLPRPKLSRAT